MRHKGQKRAVSAFHSALIPPQMLFQCLAWCCIESLIYVWCTLNNKWADVFVQNFSEFLSLKGFVVIMQCSALILGTRVSLCGTLQLCLVISTDALKRNNATHAIQIWKNMKRNVFLCLVETLRPAIPARPDSQWRWDETFSQGRSQSSQPTAT